MIADAPSMFFGQQLWPHHDDQPVTKTLTYRNTGTEQVTLDLSVAGDAPAGMFTVSPSRVTLPAGGTATADSRVGAEDGAHGATDHSERAGRQRRERPDHPQRRELTVPIGLRGPAAKRGAVKSLVVKMSYDGGRTRKLATVHAGKDGKRHLTLTSPAPPITVGLKATLVDRDGNTATKTLPSAARRTRSPRCWPNVPVWRPTRASSARRPPP
ncbi:hypothetical protein [Streptomyces sp. NPDC047061]|uniref:hypothetical protein n=1 Tax=Streptomyces sp. NPDC047061 TaxID=3154605 RepID=UPI00340D15BB